ncbi:hypothetical protein EDB19DRAFT_1718159, partial [Suillus lakei]
MQLTPRIWLGPSSSSFLLLMRGLRRTEQICVHPKDPYKVSLSPPNSKRIDMLQSSRQTCMRSMVSNLHRSIAFETGLPVRTYIPLADVRIVILRPSHTITDANCVLPWADIAHLTGVSNDCNIQLQNREVHKDIMWYY